MSKRTIMGRLGRLAGAGLCACLLALAGGCALYLEPGPNPAHLLVSAQASVTPAMVEEALESRAHLKYRVFGGGEEVSDPLWDLRAFVPRAGGGYTPLKPLRPVENLEGYQLAATAEFLAPPGTYEVFILLECSVRHLDLSGPVPVTEYVYLITWRHTQTLELCPGCRLEIKPFEGRQPRP